MQRQPALESVKPLSNGRRVLLPARALQTSMISPVASLSLVEGPGSDGVRPAEVAAWWPRSIIPLRRLAPFGVGRATRPRLWRARVDGSSVVVRAQSRLVQLASRIPDPAGDEF